MRDGLLRLHQPRGDGLAHAVERHFLERHVAIERHHLGRRRAARHGGSSRRAAACRPPVSTSRATMRPCGPDGVMRPRSMPASRREPARQRRDDGAARDPGRAEIALGRAHLEERIERTARRRARRRPDAPPARRPSPQAQALWPARSRRCGGLRLRRARRRPRSPRPRRRPAPPRPRRRGFPRACRSWSTAPPSTPCRSRSRTGCRPASRRRRPT